MTETEVINEITKEPKWYLGVLEQSTASNFIQSYRKGMSKQKTIDAFIQKFGYKCVTEKTYVKL